jgi:hypothetical protein
MLIHIIVPVLMFIDSIITPIMVIIIPIQEKLGQIDILIYLDLLIDLSDQISYN